MINDPSGSTASYTSSLDPTACNRDPWQLAFEDVWDELGFQPAWVQRSQTATLTKTWPLLLDRLVKLQHGSPERLALLKYLWQDLSKGFRPRFMLTYHYKSPAEMGCSLQRPSLSSTTTLHSHLPRIVTQRASVLSQVPRYSAIERRRNDIDLVSKDALHIRKILVQQLWRKTTPRPQRTNPHLYFFHELGRAKLQYHTHLLISMPPHPFTTVPAITEGWKEQIQPKANSLSTSKAGFDVKELPGLYEAIGSIIYLTKEVSSTYAVLDPLASLTLRGSKARLPRAA